MIILQYTISVKILFNIPIFQDSWSMYGNVQIIHVHDIQMEAGVSLETITLDVKPNPMRNTTIQKEYYAFVLWAAVVS